ncbi:phosphate signaling complex protein PhoU [Aquibacillus albus]|uniref:Phosphate-specific transport system accessory protein PhoU n=1 Tax=Aquibacillus albus TaxID=1168171 RepID=A0ABS2MUV4_9BACI|nr:phosphate transport system protein [Aquibacillus albus]
MVAREQFNAELEKIKKMIIDLAHGSKNLLSSSVDALYNSDIELATEVIENDKWLNKLDMQINEGAILLIAKQQPVASDLRRLIVAIRIATDLERMGDNAKNIAKSAIHLGEDHGMSIHHSLRDMLDIAIKMTDLSIKAYDFEDISYVRKLAELDDSVDKMYEDIIKDMLQETSLNSKKIQHIMQMALSARYIERFADHATNVGESIMYLVKGESVDLNN